MFLPVSFRSLQRFRPDVVCLSHGATWDVRRDPGLFSSLMRVFGGGRLPYVAVCQYDTDYEPLTDEDRRRSREYFGAAAAVAFVAEENRVAAERLLAWRMPDAVAVQNPVTVAPTVLPWPVDAMTELACVARLDARAKGQDVLLEALADDRWRGRDWRLSFYGAGPDRDWLGELGRQYGLGDRIQFCGHVDDVEAVWRRCHLLVLPSRAEGTSLSLLEAMALARPAASPTWAATGTGSSPMRPGSSPPRRRPRRSGEPRRGLAGPGSLGGHGDQGSRPARRAVRPDARAHPAAPAAAGVPRDITIAAARLATTHRRLRIVVTSTTSVRQPVRRS